MTPVIRAPTTAEAVIIRVLFEELEKARSDPDNTRGRNMIYADVATRCGVSYERVEELCHRKLVVKDKEHGGRWLHGWNSGAI